MYALFLTLSLGFIQNLISFRNPQLLTLSLPQSSVMRHASINSLSNYTRKDIAEVVFAFLAGATAAEASLSMVRFLSDRERNRTIDESIEESLSLL